MKEYILIKGTDKDIEDFEDQMALALEQGYELSGDLITHIISDNTIIFLQPMFLSDDNYNENDKF